MDRHTRHIRHRLFLFVLLLSSFVGMRATSQKVVVTSGHVVYDAFGRAVAVYHPTVDTDSVDALIKIGTVLLMYFKRKM